MKNEIKIYNTRQIRLMEKLIRNYSNNKISLISLSKDLYALVKQIQEPPEGFFHTFAQALSWIEATYIDASDEHRNYFTSEELSLIKEGLAQIKTLIAAYKKDYLSDFDSDLDS